MEPGQAANPSAHRRMNEPAQHTHEQAADRANEPGNWYPENLARIDRGLAAIPGPRSGRAAAGGVRLRQHLRVPRRGPGGLLPPAHRAALPPPPGGAGRPAARGPGGPGRPAHGGGHRHPAGQLPNPVADDRAGEAAAARQRPEAELFACLLLWFTDRARRDQRLGPPYVLPFMGKLLAGHTLAELRRFAAEVVRTARDEPLVETTLASRRRRRSAASRPVTRWGCSPTRRCWR